MKNKVFSIIFILFLLIFSILHIILPDNEISYSERRKLKSFPEFKLSSEYIQSIESYLLDHFPFRDKFRSIKANYNYKVLNMLDNNIYVIDNYIFKSDYPTNKKSIDNFVDHIDNTKNNFNDSNFYTMIVPDKNYYVSNEEYLNIDYDYLFNELKDISNIDIRNVLNINDYYETDTHWKQENLDKIVNELSNKLNFDYVNYEYQKNIYDKFYGVLYSESGLSRKPEHLTYLTNDILSNSSVKYLDNDKINTIYNINKLKSMDSYEVFLDGASSYIEIFNNTVDNKELIIFRDSFGSSIIPLLVPYYSKITVIDNRYINSDNYLKYISTNNQDVLFIYSTMLVNNSFSLKG